MVLKKLARVVDRAYVASWMQRASEVADLVGAVVPQMKYWHDGNLPRQQAVRRAAENLQADMGINALEIAGTIWQTMHLACRRKLQNATATNLASTQRER